MKHAVIVVRSTHALKKQDATLTGLSARSVWLREDQVRILRTALLAFITVILACTAFGAEVVTLPPECLGDYASIKTWVEKTVHDAPPVGGDVQMLKHWPLKYAHNEKVGEIWIVPALISLDLDGKKDHEMVFLVYHCETQKGEIYIVFRVREEDLPKYLKEEGDRSFTPPTHPPTQNADRLLA